MKTDELPIILRIVGGKTEEFAYFLDTYGQQVFTLIARMVGSEEDAQELTQDTFLKAYQHLDSFNGGSSFSTWIYRIAYNTALSALRKKPSEVLAFDDKMWASLSDTEIDDSLDSEEEATIERLHHAIGQLSPEEQAIITLFYEEDKPISELAVILKQSENNIKVKLHRLRKKLYVIMKEEERR